MSQPNDNESKRKIGQEVTRSGCSKALSIGSRIGTATAGIVELMKKLSPQEQMMSAVFVAVAEDGTDATTFGIPAASVHAAGVVIESMNRDTEDRETQALADVTIDIDGLPLNNSRRM